LKPVIAASKAHGSLVIGQLTHGGRQVSNEIVDTPVSASDIQCPPMGGMEFGKPRPLREDEIEDLIDRWAFGAEALYKAGADGCQLREFRNRQYSIPGVLACADAFLLSSPLCCCVHYADAAHGYLLSQFLSSRVNKRTDKFGGSLENKSRIVFRVIEEIKKRVDTSKFLISIKMVGHCRCRNSPLPAC
jgi:2,4-dienoyl-CoA reductase-like NADH-dependent reductase (Old Yellow Enzyme family)